MKTIMASAVSFLFAVGIAACVSDPDDSTTDSVESELPRGSTTGDCTCSMGGAGGGEMVWANNTWNCTRDHGQSLSDCRNAGTHCNGCQ
jgi:hypothetical protein